MLARNAHTGTPPPTPTHRPPRLEHLRTNLGAVLVLARRAVPARHAEAARAVAARRNKLEAHRLGRPPAPDAFEARPAHLVVVPRLAILCRARHLLAAADGLPLLRDTREAVPALSVVITLATAVARPLHRVFANAGRAALEVDPAPHAWGTAGRLAGHPLEAPLVLKPTVGALKAYMRASSVLRFQVRARQTPPNQ